MISSEGVTFKISNKTPKIFDPTRAGFPGVKPEDILMKIWPLCILEEEWPHKGFLQTSLPTNETDIAQIMPLYNGFVDTVMMAYNNHHNLVIRPDDIWIAILSQLNIYVNAHADTLRDIFVAHDGKKKIELCYDATRWTLDYASVAQDFAQLLQKNINNPIFYDLVIPDFSTTTSHDKTICSIVMMSILKSYFDYNVSVLCGIPEITLLGTRADYENILGRIQRLGNLDMGVEPRVFAALLQPIIRQFITVFDAATENPSSPRINMEFWSRMCHKEALGSGGGNPEISGWITAFCVWHTENARWLGPDVHNFFSPTLIQSLQIKMKQRTTAIKRHWWGRSLILDKMEYPVIKTTDVPSGMCEAKVKINDSITGKQTECRMVGGHLAMRTMIKGETEGPGSSTIMPVPLWFIFEETAVHAEPRKLPAWLRKFHANESQDSQSEED